MCVCSNIKVVFLLLSKYLVTSKNTCSSYDYHLTELGIFMIMKKYREVPYSRKIKRNR